MHDLGTVTIWAARWSWVLRQVWYPITVATLSRRARDVVEASFEATSDQGARSPLVRTPGLTHSQAA
jgi:hypothetical protein